MSHAVALAGAAVAFASCGEEPAEAPGAIEVPVAASTPGSPTPTVIERRAPSATPTPEPDPLFPVESKVLPGVLVPYAAELMVFSQPRTGTEPETGGVRAVADARADYHVPDTDAATLRAWFLEHMPAAGWGEGVERDGALVFMHTVEGTLRQTDDDDEGARTATVFFDRGDEVSFTVLAEEGG